MDEVLNARARVAAQLSGIATLAAQMAQQAATMPDAAGLDMHRLELQWNALSGFYDEWWTAQNQARTSGQV